MEFIFQGGIDCFSRIITYTNCSITNLISTVFINDMGLPEQIYFDHGGENIDVCKCILDTYNNDLNCVPTGSSTRRY